LEPCLLTKLTFCIPLTVVGGKHGDKSKSQSHMLTDKY